MDTAPAAASMTQSPTLSMAATQAGVILGTAAYMSPEQAKGFTADHWSDLFSFGVVLYEMLTGRQPFQGDTVPDVRARDPDFNALPPNLNPRLPELLRRCQEKNPKRRWQAAGDLRAELESVAASPLSMPASTHVIAQPRSLWGRAMPVLAGVILASAVTSVAWWTVRPSTPPTITRGSSVSLWTFSLQDKKVTPFDTVQSVFPISSGFSPDARWVAYATREPGNPRGTIYVQPCPATGARCQISKDATSFHPLWSPDGKELFYVLNNPDTIVAVRVMTQPSFTFGNPVAAARGLTESGVFSRNYDITPDGQRFVDLVDAEETQTGGPAAAEIREIRVVLDPGSRSWSAACRRTELTTTSARIHAVADVLSRSGRQDRKSSAASGSVDREVPSVEGEDPGEIFPLGDSHQRRVGEIHRQVTVLLHQLPHARRIPFVERRKRQRLRFHAAPESLLAAPRGTQQVHGFSERRPNRDQRIMEGLERRHTRRMVRVVLVEKRDERARVNEHAAHGPCGERSR
jgi:hypothetical protein